jgi:predicted SprT family Zn-dependent metalloprotease
MLHYTRREHMSTFMIHQENILNKENQEERNNTSTRNETIQERYDSFPQYHTLWKMLSSDKDVLEEMKSFRNNPSVMKTLDPNSDPMEQQAKHIGRMTNNDFMSAIANKESITFQVDACCDMIGCEGCVDPIYEEEKDESVDQERIVTDPIHSLGSVRKSHFQEARTLQYASSGEDDDDEEEENFQSSSSSNSSSSGGSTIVAFNISHLGVEDEDDHTTSSSEASKNLNESDLGLDMSQLTISPSLHDNSMTRPSECKDESSSEVEWNDDEDEEEDESIVSDDDIMAQENTIIILDDDDDESDYESDYDTKSLVDEALGSDKPQKSSKKDKLHFKRNRDAITLATKQLFDKTVFKGALESVQVTYVPRLTSTAGLTRLKTRTTNGVQSRLASIELSSKLIDDEQRLRSTLMHELCHAAAFLVDGVTKPPHGACFKKWSKVAMKLIPEITVSTTHSYVTNTHKYAWACTNSDCRIIIKRHSNSVNVDRHVCGKCKSKLIEIEVKSKDSSEIVPKKKREASGFSLYVQQHSSSVRARLEKESKGKKIEQKEVMKELSVMWRNSKNDKTNDQ